MSDKNGVDSSRGSVTIVLVRGKATQKRVEGEKKEILRCVPNAKIQQCDTWPDAKDALQRELVLPQNELQSNGADAVEMRKAVVLHVAGYRKPREFVECVCGCLHLINCLRCRTFGMDTSSSEDTTVIKVSTGTEEYKLADFIQLLREQTSHTGTAIHFAVCSSNSVVMQVQRLDADAGVLNAEGFYGMVQSLATHKPEQVEDDEVYDTEALKSAVRDLLEAIGIPGDEDLCSTVRALTDDDSPVQASSGDDSPVQASSGDDSPVQEARPRALEFDGGGEETKGGIRSMLTQVYQRALDTAGITEPELHQGTPLSRLQGLGPKKIEKLKSAGITSIEQLSIINIIKDCDRLKSAFDNKRVGRAMKRLLKYRERARRYVQNMVHHDVTEVYYLLSVKDDEAANAESCLDDSS